MDFFLLLLFPVSRFFWSRKEGAVALLCLLAQNRQLLLAHPWQLEPGIAPCLVQRGFTYPSSSMGGDSKGPSSC